MRPQLMDIIVVLMWLSLISIPSSQHATSSHPGGGNNSGPLTTKTPPPSASPQLPPAPTISSTSKGISVHSSQSPVHSPHPPPPKDGRGGENPSANSPGGKTHRSDKGGPASGGEKKQPFGKKLGGEKKQPFGKKLGIWFLGIAGGLQVAAVAFLSFKRRQISGILEKSGTQLGD